jgi:CBS domain containing-hemolysin-like protein
MTSDNPEPGERRIAFDRILAPVKKLLDFRKKSSLPFSLRDYENLDLPRQEMIRGVFALSRKNARDIMIPRVDIVAADIEIDLKSLVRLVHDAGHSRLPVYEETIDNIVGILYAKDLLKLLLERPKKFQLKKFLHAPYFVPETMALDELLLQFKSRKFHQAIVVDEYGGVDGIITMEDILEEIVGDINDEFDSDTLPEIEKIKERVYDVDSRMTLLDFNRELGLDLPLDDFDTIGGYVFDLFGKVPEKNEEISENGIVFRIKAIKGTIINRITVTLPDTSQQKSS